MDGRRARAAHDEVPTPRWASGRSAYAIKPVLAIRSQQRDKQTPHPRPKRNAFALNPRWAKASPITAFAGTGGKSNTANYAMNMLFAPPGFSPADIVSGIIAANNCGEWMDQMISDGIDSTPWPTPVSARTSTASAN